MPMLPRCGMEVRVGFSLHEATRHHFQAAWRSAKATQRRLPHHAIQTRRDDPFIEAVNQQGKREKGKQSMSEDECNRVHLKEHLETRMAELEERFSIRMRSSDEALRLARQDMERRLEELNKLRSEVTADRGQFIHKEVYDLWHDLVEKRLTTVETRSVTWTAAIALFFIIVSVILKVIK